MSSPDDVSIDFNALRDKASAIMDAGEAARAAEATPAAPVTPPVVETKVETPAADKVETAAATEVPATPDPVLAELTDDALVKVTVDGEEVTMPWKDAKAGISRTSKFTKSMQQLAQERKAFDADRTQLATMKQEREQLAAFLSNPDALSAYLAQIAPQSVVVPQTAPALDPSAVITVAEAQLMAQQQSQAALASAMQQMQQIAAQKDTQIADAISNLEHKQQTAKHAAVIDTTLKDIFAANPVLNGIPNAEDLIRYNVAMMNPQTEADALDAFRQVAGGIVENVAKHFTATKKVAAVQQAKAKLTASTIEPAGGAAPQIAATDFKNTDGGVNWNKVRDMAAAAYSPKQG